MKRVPLMLCFCILAVCAGCQNQDTGSLPLIGITSVYKFDTQGASAYTQVNFAYVEAVAENGGVPIVLPTVDNEAIMRRYLKELDGLVLVGGADIPPAAYGQEPHDTVRPLPAQRYDFERKLIAKWLQSGKPLLGVCLGMQFTNVVAGGTLIQDIPSQVGTKVNHRGYHRVQIERGSSLAKILDAEETLVYSNHHQAVKNLGHGLRVVAHSEDEVIEALERIQGGFGLFVQWHPELTNNAEHHNAIYGALVQASTR